MWKKITASVIALCFAAAANCNLCIRLSVDGRELEGSYSPEALRRGISAAAAAEEEIVRRDSGSVELERQYALCFIPPQGEPTQLSHALLKASKNIMSTYGVYVDGKRLGSVPDEAALRERLDRFINGQMPTWAVRGGVSRHVDIRREYSRMEPYVTLDDMVLLISGAAPVLYTDGSGYVSRA